MSVPKKILNLILKKILGVEEVKSLEIGEPKRILLIRQHNQLGDLLASTPVLRAIKETFPAVELTAITSPQNYKAYLKNPFLDKHFIFDKHKLFEKKYFNSLKNLLKIKYDIAIVPAVTSISFTSNLLARLSSSKIRIGVKSLNGKVNSSHFFFDRLVEHDWRKNENKHIIDRNLELVENFGIRTSDHQPIIYSDETDRNNAKNFIESIPGDVKSPVIGLHVGAGKIQNRWDHSNFSQLIELLIENFDARIYLSEGGSQDSEIIGMIKQNVKAELMVFNKKGMGVLKETINCSDLFITNDTGPMHAAAASYSPVISIFGPTNPHMWAPRGENKIFVWKDDNINKVTVNDVYSNAELLLKNNIHK